MLSGDIGYSSNTNIEYIYTGYKVHIDSGNLVSYHLKINKTKGLGTYRKTSDISRTPNFRIIILAKNKIALIEAAACIGGFTVDLFSSH